MTTSAPLLAVCPEFTVCGQIALEDVAKLAAKGFRSIINNRPDGEGGPSQPTSAQIEAEARAHGLAYVHFPIHSPMEAMMKAEAYQAACSALPHPMVAFCRSGGRAQALFQASGGKVGCPT
jgi:uncharacterized protein (TIGR01244 family)